MIREKWTKFRHGFYGFDINRLAGMKAGDLMRDSGVTRNRKKVQAIIHNAKDAEERAGFYKAQGKGNL